MDNLISRQAAIDAIRKIYDSVGILGEKWAVDKCQMAIKDLPSAQPERKTGKWIRHDEIKNLYGGICIECSECGEKYVVQHILDEKYCRNCGADMRGEQDARLNQQTGSD